MRLTERDLSTLAFQARVLEEAALVDTPLMERANFVAIASSNCEEFQRVRLPRLKGSVRAAAEERLRRLYDRMAELYAQVMEAASERIVLPGVEKLSGAETAFVQARAEEIIARLRPVPPEEAPGSELLLAVTHDDDTITLLALPQGQPRLIRLPGEAIRLIPVESALARHIYTAFDGVGVTGCGAVRLLRDEHFVADEDEQDVRAAAQECLDRRRSGRVMRLLAAADLPEMALAQLCDQLPVAGAAVMRMQGCFHPGSIMAELAALDGLADWHYPPFTPARWPQRAREDVFAALRDGDRLLIHPYDSFEPVLLLLQQAAKDPDVSRIRMTLYRAKADSLLVDSLEDAARAGKQVDVLVETRARFDEARNLTMAARLEDAGCRVLSGPPGLKVHSKVLQVVRREGGYPHLYTHLGTGNYHEGTAKIYTDFGLMTADREIGADAARFFDYLTGEAGQPELTALTASPFGLRQELLRMIRREMGHALSGRTAAISLKLNALTDRALIDCLLDAGRAGVKVDITVRGACCLQCGTEDTPNVTVRSIVGRFLEHGRMVRFENGGRPETYISSADWMKRSLDRRVELLTPVRDARAQEELLRYITLQQQDTAKAWLLKVDDYTAARCCSATRMDSQQQMLDIRSIH